jgi:subtilase family serine protease
VSYPAGDPFVTSVGGVTAYLSPFGQIQAPVLAWGISTSETINGGIGYGATGASGGGTSTFMPAPSWQKTALGATLREQPDVSLVGDPSTGVTFYTNGSSDVFPKGPSAIGGTSVAAPEMAAVWSLVLSACQQNPGKGMCPASSGGKSYRLGNASPYLYAIYHCSATPCSAFSWTNNIPSGVPSPGPAGGSLTAALAYGSVFYDVLYGSNEMQNPDTTAAAPIPGAQAMTGYDQTTGVGVPFAGHLIQAITGLALQY